MIRPEDGVAAAAERRLATVGRLAGALAHDFNNLLTAILGYAELLLDELPSGDARRDDLLEIRRSGERAARLTRQLLSFKRNADAPAQLLSWPALIQELLPLLEAAAGDRVRVAVEADEVPEVSLQKADASHVLFAIVLLARDGLPCGGRCGFEVRHGRAGGVTLVATLEPEGEHQPPPLPGDGLADLEQLTAASCGTLATVAEWPQRQRFVIDYQGAEAAAGESPGETGADPVHALVLLAEDEPMLGPLIRRMLEGQGLSVVDVVDGAEALARLREPGLAFDVLVTDLVMPGASGIDLARAVAAERPGIGVLFISGYADGATSDLAPLRTPWVFLPKPFTREQLMRAIADLQADRRRRAQA